MNLTGFFREIINLSLMGTVLAALLLLLKSLFKRHLSALWHYSVWFLLVLRLILPVAPENGFSIYNLFKPVMSEVRQQTATPDYIPVTVQLYNSQVDNESKNNALSTHSMTKTTKADPGIMDILALIWLLGTGATGSVIVASNVRFYGEMRYSVPCKDQSSIDILEDCYKLAAIKKRIPLYIHRSAQGPMLFGIIRPRLILPQKLLNLLSPAEKRYIFLHELIHFKRRDIILNLLTAFLKCIYWFNPMILYAFYKMREDCELSCDESVLKKLTPREYRDYGQTILNLAEMASGLNTPVCTSGLMTKKSSVKRRINMISKFRQTTVMGTIAALAITLLVGCSVLTNAKNDRNMDLNEPAPTPAPIETVNLEQPSESPEKESLADPAKESIQQEQTVEEKVEMYLDKLKDKSFTGTYGDGYTWYTAAEELGMIGKPAIPGLMKKLDTKDDYERALALYALLLATQHDNVKSFTNGDYINVNLDFNPESHPAMVEKAKAWWDKHKDNF